MDESDVLRYSLFSIQVVASTVAILGDQGPHVRVGVGMG